MRLGDKGSAVVEFVLVAPLLLVLSLAVIQVALLLHARATLTAAAAEGARAGALSGADSRAGVRRAAMLVEQNVSDALVQEISAVRDVVDGLAVLTVTIEAEVPSVGLLGPTHLRVEGHALVEPGAVTRATVDERGSAVIEFIVIGVAVLVPMVYIVQCVMVVHSAMLASGHAAREAARAFSTAVTTPDGRHRAVAAARLAFRDQGIDLPEGALRVSCADGPCLAPGSAVIVTLDWAVPLPWIPESWFTDARIPIVAEQWVPIDDLRSDQR